MHQTTVTHLASTGPDHCPLLMEMTSNDAEYINHPHYHGFNMEVRGPQVNHFSFAHDTILFTLGIGKTPNLIMKTLKIYEKKHPDKLLIVRKVTSCSIQMHSKSHGTKLSRSQASGKNNFP